MQVNSLCCLRSLLKSRINLGAWMLGMVAVTGCENKQPLKTTPDTVGVRVLRLSAGSSSSVGNLIYNGTVQADKIIDLSFQVSGTITSLPVQTGQFVKKGQLIARVDETTFRSQYEAQQAQARLAQENYTRTLQVYNKGSIAEIKMLEARSNAEQTAAAANATYQNIVHTKLFAPQNGYIGDKKVEAGATASPGMSIVQLLDIRSVQVLVNVPDNEINRYHTGDPAQVTIDALGNNPLSGRISEIGVLAVTGSASYNVKVNIANGDQLLKPGMLCKVTLQPSNGKAAVAAADSTVIVPAQAVQVDEQGRNFVYVLDPAGKEALRREVQTGALFNTGIVIKTGLSGNEQLIISGYQKLGDHTPITITQ